MAKQVKPLSATEVKNARCREKEYSLSDGNGLYLRLKPNNSKNWIFNYTHPITKKRKNIGLGAYPATSLANAREKASAARELISQGIDPKTHRENELFKAQMKTNNTLKTVAATWFDVKKASITEDHATDIWRSLELHVFPNLGNLPISDITAPVAIKTLGYLQSEGKLDMLKRVCARLNEVMTFAVHSGLLEFNQLVNIKKAFKQPRPTPMKAVHPDQMGFVMRKMSESNMTHITRCAFEFQLHTLVRPNEAALAEWNEIDFANRLWVIPESKMKKNKVHRIPLSEASISILEQMRPISFGKNRYVFPAHSKPNHHINSQTVNNAIKNAGLNDYLVSHGLRSIGSTLLNEQDDYDFDKDAIEVVLSHVGTDKIRMAYNRAEYVDKRRPIMDYWSQFILKASRNYFTIARENANEY
ncbi:integrase arm-type DNA-binding domain-containing protein [Vibrio alginolyticus]|uniref:integrase arm-type DNA-binding domain-containing protein n=1 Tax=Vibrio alginolyticus TaxID=663 RepID=UPI003D7DF000